MSPGLWRTVGNLMQLTPKMQPPGATTGLSTDHIVQPPRLCLSPMPTGTTNAQCSKFYSATICSGTAGVDALMQCWSGMK
jgi:hypothetical protein